MNMRVAMIVICFTLCIGLSTWSFAETKNFVCSGSIGNQSFEKEEITVETSAVSIEGKVHQAGGINIGHAGNIKFSLFWDSTTHGVALVRNDTDGFAATAVGYEGNRVRLIVKRPNYKPEDMALECYPP